MDDQSRKTTTEIVELAGRDTKGIFRQYPHLLGVRLVYAWDGVGSEEDLKQLVAQAVEAHLGHDRGRPYREVGVLIPFRDHLGIKRVLVTIEWRGNASSLIDAPR